MSIIRLIDITFLSRVSLFLVMGAYLYDTGLGYNSLRHGGIDMCLFSRYLFFMAFQKLLIPSY